MADQSREGVLRAFGLQDRAVFAVGHDHGQRDGTARVRIGATGDPCQHFSVGHAAKLAAALDGVDVPLAARIRRAVQDASKPPKG